MGAAAFLLMGMAPAIVVGAWVAHVRREARGRRAWTEVARELDLRFVREWSLVSQPGRPHVFIDVRKKRVERHEVPFTVIEVAVPAPAAQLTLSSESGFTKLRKLLGADDVTTGDAAFDAAVHVRGPAAIARAVLGPRARALLPPLVRGGVELRERRLTITLRGVCTDGPRMLRLVTHLQEAAEALDDGASGLDEVLARRLAEEPDWQVRRSLFEAALGSFHESSATRSAAQGLLADEHPALRIAAALLLKDAASFDVLQALVTANVELAHRLDALHALVDWFPYEEVAPLLDDVLRGGRPELRVVALQALARRRDRTRVEAAVRCLGRGNDALTIAALDALAVVGDASHTEVLVGELARDSVDVQVAAVRALGAVGAVAAVEALLPHASGLLPFGGLKAAAVDAIRAIQSRAGPVEGGRLSLVEEDVAAGGLSLAVEGGGLSVAESPEGDARPPHRLPSR